MQLHGAPAGQRVQHRRRKRRAHRIHVRLARPPCRAQARSGSRLLFGGLQGCKSPIQMPSPTQMHAHLDEKSSIKSNGEMCQA